MRTADFDYELPPEFIAQTPIEPRDAARLLVLERKTGAIEHATFNELGSFLRRGDLLVLNETRVIPARLFARKIPGGGRMEILLLKKIDDCTWEALVGGKGARVGRRMCVERGPELEVIAISDGPQRLIRYDEPIEPFLDQAGHMPLPPYIHTPLHDSQRYQTIYAQQPGSAAAPTAGLHFTNTLLQSLQHQGIATTRVTLHVGLDTFAPVTEQFVYEHRIHTEWCQLPQASANAINEARLAGNRIVAVGTTSVRTLESAARLAAPGETVGIMEGPTDLFIVPGYRFKAVDALITNFHLPRSTLLMLVSAFASRERVLQAYETAKRSGYRFYSFGDAMLIL